MRLVSVSGRTICTYTHTNNATRTWQRGDAPESVVLLIQANGVQQIKLRCTNCRFLTGALPKEVSTRWGLWAIPPGEVRDNRANQKCSVVTCASTEVELHHFAPYNTFGAEADDWPVMPLCRRHHHEWHARMDGYQWRRKAAAW